MPNKICAHPACSCPATQGEYCGDGCEQASAGSSEQRERCRCQHPECQPKA